MNLKQSICSWLRQSQPAGRDPGTQPKTDDSSANILGDAISRSTPRDGMSSATAKYLIGRCRHKKLYEIYGIQNHGRYFVAEVSDLNGNVVNEVLVDKETGRVQFMRNKY